MLDDDDPKLLVDPKLDDPCPVEDGLLKPVLLLEPVFELDPNGEPDELEEEEEPKVLRLNVFPPLERLGLDEPA